MKNKIILIAAFSIYDSVFNIILNTESIINQTIYFLFISAIILTSLIHTRDLRLYVQWHFISWACICYWFSMATMYIFAAIKYNTFNEWILFNKDKAFTYYFLALWVVSFLLSWFLYKNKKVN